MDCYLAFGVYRRLDDWKCPVTTYINKEQFAIPKGVRDRMSLADEAIIYELIDFAYEQGRNRGYDEGYEDASVDAREGEGAL